MTCGLIFVVHGVVDVAAHRMGSAFAGLFVITLAFKPQQRFVAAPVWRKWLFRGIGIAFCAVGTVWLAATCQHAIIPGQIGVIECKQQVSLLNKTGDYPKAIALATSALDWAPMDWQLYYFRAISEALGTDDFRAAVADFNRARFLNPITPDLAFDEGLIWLKRRPSLTFPAWQEALKRAGDSQSGFYGRMLVASSDFPWLRGCLKERATGDSGLILIFLDAASQPEFADELASVLKEDPELYSFSSGEKQTLFRLWEQKGNKTDLIASSANRESWLRAGWPSIAACHADQGQYQLGYEMVLRFTHPLLAPAPPLVLEPENQLLRDLYLNPHDFAKGYGLYCSEIRSGAKSDALNTLEKLTADDHCPRYFFSLKAALYAESNRWKEAWEAVTLSGLSSPPK
jgi:tetratricopeptide (TPR) repeat protein